MFCFEICTPEGRGGRKGRECKFQNKTHITFHPRNNLSPAQALLKKYLWIILGVILGSNAIEPPCRMALWKSPLAWSDSIMKCADTAPADCPASVTLLRSPPKLSMLSLIHFRARSCGGWWNFTKHLVYQGSPRRQKVI